MKTMLLSVLFSVLFIGNMKAQNFEEFASKFELLPPNYVLDYDTMQGRNIGYLDMTKVYYPYVDEVNAIGKVLECSNGYVFLVMFRSVRSSSETVSFELLLTDNNGKSLGTREITTTQKVMGNVDLLGNFSISVNGSSYTIQASETYPNGNVTNNTISGNCN
jgi:hypothetical protein